MERILYAQNDEDAKRVISQAQLTLLSQLSLEEGGGPPPPQANGPPEAGTAPVTLTLSCR